MRDLARDGEIFAYKHEGFWKPMDTFKDKIYIADFAGFNWYRNC